MKSIHEFFSEIRNNNIALWINNNNLKISTAEEISEKIRNSIINNKQQIIDILKQNDIGSEKDFFNKIILKLPEMSHPPLSFAQERLWFMQKQNPANAHFSFPVLLSIGDKCNIESFKQSVNEIINRHETLKTIFVEQENGDSYQKTVDEIPAIKEFIFPYKTDLLKHVRKSVQNPFKLEKEIPFRSELYKLDENYFAFFNFHHVAVDGWSINIFLAELEQLYDQHLIGKQANINKLAIQYKDFAVWQREYLKGPSYDIQLDYWQNRLKDYEELNFPIDFIRPASFDYKGDDFTFIISEDISRKLQQLANDKGTTLYNILLSGFYILLSKYTQHNDIIIGTFNSNRHYPGVEKQIGFFVNMLARRFKLNANASLLKTIDAIISDSSEIQDYADIPFEKIVETLRVERTLSRHPIFNIVFAAQNFGNELQTFKQEDLTGELKFANFDITLFIDNKPSDGCIKGDFNYATSLFKKSTIEKLSISYINILKKFTEDLNITVGDLSLLTKDEYQTIVYDWNKTEAPYPKNKTIQQLFEEQVDKTPDSIALVFEDEKLTYRELNVRSNQLARYLRKEYKKQNGNDIKPDELIALCLNRSVEMIVAILGVLKAGGAYVPIDPGYPSERINYILKDTNTQVLIIQSHLRKPLETSLDLNRKLQIVGIDDKEVQCDLAKFPADNLSPISQSMDLAYIIYTSGTTGRPKGIMIEHKSLYLFLVGFIDILSCKKINLLSTTNYAFDMFGIEYLLPITTSGCLYLTNLQDFEQQLIKYHLDINLLQQTPSVWQQILGTIDNKYTKNIIAFTGGENLKPDTNRELHKHFKKIFNLYGPAETVVWSTLFKSELQRSASIIGKPLLNEKIYILDQNKQPVPVGAIGELYIGGAELARGYLNQPELTLERFIPNPFATDEDKAKNYTRLYKTGDLARWLTDGNIEYIGRNDFQVKIRGFRIELEEIETNILTHLGIQCVVVSKKISDSEEMVCYYKSSDDLDIKVLRDRLKQHLPEYMVPIYWQRLDILPLNNNGKIDRNNLKDLPIEIKTKSKNANVQLTELQKLVLTVWQELLERNDIGIYDNFFDVGGHSLKLIQLKSQLQKRLKIAELPITNFFKYPTIASFVDFILGDDTALSLIYSPVSVKGEKEIAIIAVSGAFSGAESLEAYWDGIVLGKENITFLNQDECRNLGVSVNKLSHSDYTPSSGYLKNIDKFDPYFWNLSPRDAEFMDPQIRKFLECSWNVLEESGYVRLRKNLNIGVFAGSGVSQYCFDHLLLNEAMRSEFNPWDLNIVSSNIALATRVSYLLGLTGPALNISTTCSTSLVAIIEACEKLTAGKCDIALAGGVTLHLPHNFGYIYQEGMIFSRDGHCKVFSQDADGTVGGSGVGAVALKRLSDANRDGDNILAIIKGYCINNDGDRKVGYAAPSVEGQAECILSAQKHAGVTADTIDYIECHGTGTKLGDPIEIEALNQVFKANTPEGKKADCILGSVKANIGHTDTAAGVAGVIKICKMLGTKIIPPQINFRSPNPELHLDKTPFQIITQKQAWFRKDHPRRAGISAFGVGGTNAHIILEEYNGEKKKEKKRKILTHPYILPFSAKNYSSLKTYTEKIKQFIKSEPDINLADLAYTLQIKKEHFNVRNAIVSDNTDDTINKLNLLENPTSLTKQEISIKPSLVFMFSGMGSQYPSIIKTFYKQLNVFKENLDYCIDIISDIKNTNFRNVILPNDSNKGISDKLVRLDHEMLILFSFSYSIAKQLEHWGITPDVCIGQSIGEYTAATIAGIFNLDNALKIIATMGDLIEKTAIGKVLSINATSSYIKKYLSSKEIEISAINATETCVVSGVSHEIEKLEKILKHKSINYSIIYTKHAIHSFMMEPILNEFNNFVSEFTLHKPSKKIISNVTGAYLTDQQAVDPTYWSSLIRNTVLFSKGIDCISDSISNLIFIEIGSENGLSTFVKQAKTTLQQKTCKIVQSSLFKKESKVKSISQENNLYSLVGELWQLGYSIDWAKIHDNDIHKPKHIVNFPLYQFEEIKCWVDKAQNSKINEEISNKIITYLKKENILTTEDQLTKIKDLLIQKKTTTLDIKEIPKTKILIEKNVSEQENRLALIFRDFLGHKRLSVFDDFFELGVDSLMAAELIDKINKEFSTNYSPSMITLTPNISSLSKEITKRESLHSLTIELKKGTEYPIFLVHPIGGEVLFYREFAKNYKGNNSVYGIIDPKYKKQGSVKPETLEIMASMYIKEIDRLSHKGYYIVGGASFGGVVAYEIANQLINRGDKVLCFLIDSPGPKLYPKKLQSTYNILKYYMSYGKEKVNEATKMLNNINYDENELFEFIIENKILNFDSKDLLQQQVDIYKENESLMHNYRTPQKHKEEQQILYFKAIDWHPHLPKNIEDGWKGTIDKIQIFEIPGNHISMNFSPNVENICNILTNKIKSL
ncbi:MAG TPA: hypothetical protein DD381_10010 [Lentisphaeria bacterium]|nr:MAG: hypothetical protein A2X47_13995 [Lentisphaerae bacterium GWF2_38_69]HBM16658.1 hypothetical protein [Lentisphaeria bacterium]